MLVLIYTLFGQYLVLPDNNIHVTNLVNEQGVMKRAVKWTSTDVDCRPGRKKQDGQRRPRKGLWRQRQPSRVKVDKISSLPFLTGRR